MKLIVHPLLVIMLLFLSSYIPTGTVVHARESEKHGFTRVLGGLKFPEGPAWDGKTRLYASNCHGDWIAVIGPDTQNIFLRASEKPLTFSKTNGLAFYKDGSLFACDFGLGAILRITMDGKSEIYADGYTGKKFNRPNDLAFDHNGHLYFTDPNKYDRNNPDGFVYRVDAKTREVTPVASDLAFPNGLAFSADGSWLYVCESACERILKFKVKKDGMLADRSVFIELPGGDPDGIAFDRGGNLYVAHFGGSAIYVINPEGQIQEILMTPGKKPSNVAFGDVDLKTLYITEDETNAIYTLRVDTPGLSLFYAPKY
ncbi:SMP-30/gluconolactonase/LRE family protein [candidate division KSB1 bacterium]|nr:SMP-30/gluconolactonase/LRE family protein [candidate division KSB1 bacterium]